MYTKTKYVLDNGQEFETAKEAQKALDNLYGEALRSVAMGLGLVADAKFFKTLEYLDKNIDQLINIVDLYQELKAGFRNEQD